MKVLKDFDNFFIFYEFLKIGQTTFDQSLSLVHEILESYTYGVLWSHCGVASPHDVPFLFVKGILVDASQINGSLNLIFFHLIFEIFKPIWKCMVLAQFGMCGGAHLCKIWANLGNAR